MIDEIVRCILTVCTQLVLSITLRVTLLLNLKERKEERERKS